MQETQASGSGLAAATAVYVPLLRTFCHLCQAYMMPRHDHYNNPPKYSKCGTCGIEFASKRLYEEVCDRLFLSVRSNFTHLLKHLANQRTCHVCHVHLGSHEGFDIHYRNSPNHPKCRRCGSGFMTTLQYGIVSVHISLTNHTITHNEYQAPGRMHFGYRNNCRTLFVRREVRESTWT